MSDLVDKEIKKFIIYLQSLTREQQRRALASVHYDFGYIFSKMWEEGWPEAVQHREDYEKL